MEAWYLNSRTKDYWRCVTRLVKWTISSKNGVWSRNAISIAVNHRFAVEGKEEELLQPAQ